MPCIQEITLTDKIVEFIKINVPDYVYNYGNFGVYEDPLDIRPWEFNFNKPTYEDLEKIVVVKKCPKSCLNCIIERLDKVEVDIEDMKEEMKTFE